MGILSGSRGLQTSYALAGNAWDCARNRGQRGSWGWERPSLDRAGGEQGRERENILLCFLSKSVLKRIGD